MNSYYYNNTFNRKQLYNLMDNQLPPIPVSPKNYKNRKQTIFYKSPLNRMRNKNIGALENNYTRNALKREKNVKSSR